MPHRELAVWRKALDTAIVVCCLAPLLPREETGWFPPSDTDHRRSLQTEVSTMRSALRRQPREVPKF